MELKGDDSKAPPLPQITGQCVLGSPLCPIIHCTEMAEESGCLACVSVSFVPEFQLHNWTVMQLSAELRVLDAEMHL